MSDQPISWMTLSKGTRVVASDGEEIGKVETVVADQEKDIFSGLAIAAGLFDKDRFVPADLVTEITEHAVQVSLTSQEAENLEPYEG